MRLRSFMVGVLLPLVLACSEDGSLMSPGDPCRSLMRHCSSDDDVLMCTENVWVEAHCSEFCAELAPGVDSLGCVEDDCKCTPPPGGCVPGESACVDVDELRWCEASWTWAEDSCSHICSFFAPQSISQGCSVADDEGGPSTGHCVCTSEGAGCSPQDPSFCAGDSTLAVCIDQVWTYSDCDESCGHAAPCRPNLSPGAMCVC